jgi:hypothetical protein
MNKMKVKVTRHMLLESLRGSKGIALHILNIGAREGCVVKTTLPLLLAQEKRPVTEGLIPLSLQLRAQVTSRENA